MKLEESARALLAANTQSAEGVGERFVFSVPSLRAYPFQWFWDSCFHAVVWSRFDWRRAADELAGLFHWQDESGFIPHVVFWNRSRVSARSWHYLESRGPPSRIPFSRKPMTTAGIQPAVIAQAVERIVAAGGGDAYLRQVLPALERYYRYLAAVRDPDRDALISIISQFESGLDFSPAYDDALGIRSRNPTSIWLRARFDQLKNKLVDFDLDRVFRSDHHQEDVLVNAVFAQGLRSLARLAHRSNAQELSAWATEQASAVSTALLERCYDEHRRLFFNLVGPQERRGSVKTIHSLMPLILDELPRDVVDGLVEHLTDRREFWAPFPVASVALDEPSFLPDHHLWGLRLIWRGPSSMNTNWFLVHGLRRHGYDDVAGAIAERSRELVARGGFNEFYNPLSGKPVGAERFGWATLVVDL